MTLKSLLVSTATVACLATAVQAAPIDVDLELLFMNDVSGSIDSADYNFQIQGFAAAFRDATLIQKIQDGAIGKIAVSMAFFASTAVQSIGWTIIEDAASGEAFAQALEALARPSAGGSDNTSVALTTAVGWFADDINSARQVIDVVTEGAQDVSGCQFDNPVCVPLQNARDAALAAGIDQINAMLLDDRDFFGNDPADIIQAVPYAQTNIIGGTGSFAVFEENFTGFSGAIKDKILREVAPPPVPLPIPATMLGGGLMLLAGFRRVVRRT